MPLSRCAQDDRMTTFTGVGVSLFGSALAQCSLRIRKHIQKAGDQGGLITGPVVGGGIEGVLEARPFGEAGKATLDGGGIAAVAENVCSNKTLQMALERRHHIGRAFGQTPIGMPGECISRKRRNRVPTGRRAGIKQHIHHDASIAPTRRMDETPGLEKARMAIDKAIHCPVHPDARANLPANGSPHIPLYPVGNHVTGQTTGLGRAQKGVAQVVHGVTI